MLRWMETEVGMIILNPLHKIDPNQIKEMLLIKSKEDIQQNQKRNKTKGSI